MGMGHLDRYALLFSQTYVPKNHLCLYLLLSLPVHALPFALILFYKEFLQSDYLKSFIVDECFISVYKDFENIENLQLYKKIDNPEKYYILHFTKCGLVPSNTKLMFMPYYYKYYKNEVLNTDVSIKFKKFILNMFKNWYIQRIE